MPAGATTETYGVASDGVVLKWDRYDAVGTAQGTVILIHGGGFVSGSSPACQLAGQDLSTAGYHAYAITYRLACPGGIAGQTPCPRTGGQFPDQELDARRAVRAARALHPTLKCFVVGGSAGGTQAIMLAFDKVLAGTVPDPWTLADRPDGIICLSPATDFTDRVPHFNLDAFRRACCYYTGIPLPPGDDIPANTAIELAASPVSFITSDGKPTKLVRSTEDTMPWTQDGLLIDKFIAAGFTNYTEHIIPPTAKGPHAFDLWEGVSGESIAFIQNIVDGGGSNPPPPPGPTMYQGVSIGTPSGNPVNQSLLDNPDIDGIGLNVHWFDLETADGTYDYTYLDGEIKRVAAANKRVTIRITSMQGSQFYEGNTPNWLFTAIGATPDGNPGSITDGVTDGTATIHSSMAHFTMSGDLHSPITGTDIPANTYIGTVLTPTSVMLSSSPTSQVDVNATGTHTACAWTIANRPRVAYNTHATVWGQTFDYLDPSTTHMGDPETTIPVYWQRTYLNRKARMLNYLGDHITNGNTLTIAEKAAVTVIGVSYANAQTEDWNIPADDTVDNVPLGNTLTRLEKWLNSDTLDDVTQRGAGYTTQKMINAAVRQSHDAFADGQTFTNKRLVSATANFTFADIGKTIQAATVIPAGTKIASWVSHTEVLLDTNTTGTGTGLTFTVRFRDTGLFDVAVAAFPGSFITTAIGSNDPRLDADAALAAGDPDAANFLARTVQNLVNTKYPTRIITQKNNFSAKTKKAPGQGGSSQALLFEIGQTGNWVAAQDLWFCFNDPTFRMNGGQPGIDEDISEAAALTEFGYGCQYREMYQTDGLNMPLAIKFTHDLFNGTETGPPPSIVPPPSVSITGVDQNFRDGVFYEVAALLNIDPRKGLEPARSQRWIISINRHLRYAWRLYFWPELLLTEERAFRPIWNATERFALGDEVYYLPDGLYYQAIDVPGINKIPPNEPTFWQTFTLLSSDFFIPTRQPCRWEIGDVVGVFPANPAVGPLDYARIASDWRRSSRGVEVYGTAAASTVFIRHRIAPPRYTGTSWVTGSSYKAGDLVLWDATGEVYRAIIDVAGIAPSDATRWAFVPFPVYLANYCIYMAAADDSDDVPTAADYRQVARDFLFDEVDKYYIQDTVPTYNFGRRQLVSLPSGTSGFIWSASPPFTETSSPTTTTISDACLDRFGSVVPTT